eukprot:180974-Pyramimonas_sp.AAC.1
MKSTLLFTPHTRSARSLSVNTGRSTAAPGRLQFLRSPTLAVLSACVRVRRACDVSKCDARVTLCECDVSVRDASVTRA